MELFLKIGLIKESKIMYNKFSDFKLRPTVGFSNSEYTIFADTLCYMVLMKVKEHSQLTPWKIIYSLLAFILKQGLCFEVLLDCP